MRVLITGSLAVALAALFAAPANASFEQPRDGEVALRDMPGTDEAWQEARTVVDAPPETVRRWLTDFEFWPARFHDVESTHVLERDATSAVLRMRSRIMGRELTLHATLSAEGVTYTAREGSVRAVGRIYVTPLGDGRTVVLMQSMARVSGILGALAPHDLVRNRQREKLTADLVDLHRLARSRTSLLARDVPPSATPASISR